MNLVLLFPQDFTPIPNIVRVAGRRYDHIIKVIQAGEGDAICVGLVDGKIGTGRILNMNEESLEMEVVLNQEPPKPLPLTLILALPRPQVIKRTLLCAASLGIKKLVFLNFFRVERTFWQSSTLGDDAIRDQLILGLEQSKDTALPDIQLRRFFKPFVEDELPGLMKNTQPFLAHPSSGGKCPRGITQPVTLVIGPEGGLIDYEIEKLTQLGFKALDFGPRILRVESVLPLIVGRMF